MSNKEVLDIGITVNNDLLTLLGDKLYSNDQDFILTRELIQNSIDAGSTDIAIDIDTIGDSYKEVMIVTDNGCGMDKDTLLNVFLGIGQSKKFTDSVGGFGIAKVAIFSCKYWEVKTKSKSSNLEYTIQGGTESNGISFSEKLIDSNIPYSFTEVTVELDDIVHKRIYEALVINPKRKVKIRFNDEVIESPKTRKVITVNSYNGNDYTIRFSKNRINNYKVDGYLDGRIYYRIGGLVQFSKRLYDLDEGIILVDFDISYNAKDDDYPFSMSRESINYSLDYKINDDIKGFMKDKLSRDMDLRAETKKQTVINGILYTRPPLMTLEELKNTITQDDKRIARLYRDIVAAIRPSDKDKLTRDFMLGITLEDDINGYNGNHEGIKVFGINPTHFRNQSSKVDLILALWHLAIHEISHDYYSYHDENFTSKEGQLAKLHAKTLDQNMAKLLKKGGYIEYLK